MIPIKVPDWWDSIRAIIALSLVGTLCIAMLLPEDYISEPKFKLFKEIALYAIIFYFTLKRRKENNQ